MALASLDFLKEMLQQKQVVDTRELNKHLYTISKALQFSCDMPSEIVACIIKNVVSTSVSTVCFGVKIRMLQLASGFATSNAHRKQIIHSLPLDTVYIEHFILERCNNWMAQHKCDFRAVYFIMCETIGFYPNQTMYGRIGWFVSYNSYELEGKELPTTRYTSLAHLKHVSFDGLQTTDREFFVNVYLFSRNFKRNASSPFESYDAFEILKGPSVFFNRIPEFSQRIM